MVADEDDGEYAFSSSENVVWCVWLYGGLNGGMELPLSMSSLQITIHHLKKFLIISLLNITLVGCINDPEGNQAAEDKRPS